MSSLLDNAIATYTRTHTDEDFLEIYRRFLTESLLVPVSEPVKELEASRYDVAAICIGTETAGGAIPVFTSIEHLLKWKPQGCLYAPLIGRAIVTMVIDMLDVSEIQINPSAAPRGRIPRTDFVSMLSL